jgi:hypothetical protein
MIASNSLPEGKDDRALEAAVTREFGRFGTVFVKIRREGRGTSVGMPYAFAQYTVSLWPLLLVNLASSNGQQNDQDAKDAVEKGKGIVILGRPCRTEMAKANRKCGIDLTASSSITHTDTCLAHPRHICDVQPSRRRHHPRHRS